MTNEELIRGIKNGNKLLEDELYNNVKMLIFKTSQNFYKKNMTLLKKGCIEYDDIIQMAHISYLNSLKKYGNKEDNSVKFSTYLVSGIQLYLYKEIYPNKQINRHLRTDLNKVSIDDDDFYNCNKELSSNDKIDDKLLVEQLMSVLNKQEKEIIIDFYMNGLKSTEMQNKYGVSVVQIRNIKNRAINKMKEYGGKI